MTADATTRDCLALSDAIGRTVEIVQPALNYWQVRQIHRGFHEHYQTPTWLNLANDGSARQARLELVWAEPDLMALRSHAYLEHDGDYRVISGTSGGTSTTYELDLPPGKSGFGPVPWYPLNRAEALLERAAQAPGCRREQWGTSAEGRPLEALVLQPPSPSTNPPSVVVIAREHGGETSGSFAVEAIIEFLLNDPQAATWRKYFQFTIIPIANPDGVANGTKLPRAAPTNEVDLHYAGMTSNEPTCVALREYLLALRPACLVNFHSYLWSPPQLICYDRADALDMLEVLLHDQREEPCDWFVRRQAAEQHSMNGYCHANFGTIVGLFELPWAGREVAAIRNQGTQALKAVLHTWSKRYGGTP